tara:strand:+ start:227 stop:619 length:393 start_codon:yes stop_codon:yes gene_type:complete
MFDLEIFLKFLFAGVIGVTTNFIVTALLKEYFRVNKFYSNSSGLFFALSLNYILNQTLTFNINYHNNLVPIISFITISLASIYFNHKIVFLCTKRLKINFYLSKSFAVLILFFWNFILHSKITFNNNIFQ